MANIDSKIPQGPVAEKWTNYKAHQKLVNPANKRKLDIIVVGTGLAGASAAASLGEMGFKVLNFCIQDSPRRAHSIAAQGGINAAKNYQNDGDSVYRLFYDTVKGGDYRAREANVYRLAEVSANIIDQCVAQGVPFAREYGGLLANRSFGGVQVSRTFYAKGQTGQQLLLGAYSALMAQVHAGTVKLYCRYEMQDVVIIDGRARGIIARNLINGKLERFAAHAVVLATGGYGNTYFLSTNAMVVTARLPLQLTARVLTLPTLLMCRFTPLVSPFTATSSQSSPLCLSHCVTMAVSGCPRRRKMPLSCRRAKSSLPTSTRLTATTISSAVTPLSVTSFPATWLRVLPRSVATPALV